MKFRYLLLIFTTLFFTSLSFAMPQAVGIFVLQGLSAIGITLLPMTAGAVIAIGVATIVIGAYAGSQLLGSMIPDMPDDLTSQAQTALSNTQGATNPIPVVYGKRRVGGNPIFYHVSGTNNEYLHIVYVIAEGEIQNIQQIICLSFYKN